MDSTRVPERDAFVRDDEPRRPLHPGPPARPQRGRRPQPARHVAREEVPPRPLDPRPEGGRPSAVS